MWFSVMLIPCKFWGPSLSDEDMSIEGLYTA